MAAKTVLNYLPRESVVHKLTGTTKLAFFLGNDGICWWTPETNRSGKVHKE